MPDALYDASGLGISLPWFAYLCTQHSEAPLSSSYRPGPGKLMDVGRTLPWGLPRATYLYSLLVYIAYGGLRLWWCVGNLCASQLTGRHPRGMRD